MPKVTRESAIRKIAGHICWARAQRAELQRRANGGSPLRSAHLAEHPLRLTQRALTGGRVAPPLGPCAQLEVDQRLERARRRRPSEVERVRERGLDLGLAGAG